MNNVKPTHWNESGGQQVHYTGQDDLYIKYLSEQLPKFKGGRVLEIGPGWGKFALKLINKFELKEYNILDSEANINDSINFLNLNGFSNIKKYFSKNYKNLFGEKFDLLVANVVISEVEKEYREDLLNNIIPNCKKSMIITQINFNDAYGKWIMDLFNNNFDTVITKLTAYKNCYALTGEKNE
jgi:cyclopropane fatty-acyl-phospholipid synthase-like methyltransferase